MREHLITRTDELEAFCARCRGAPYITIDTEFLCEKTYFAKLCLVQIGVPAIDGHPAFEIALDPLSEDLNPAALEKILFDPQILKVFHAARQDLEILVKLFDGRVPAPLFDTQIAAMVTGYGDQIGYQALVKRICGVELDKSNQFTDWSRRPLSSAQLEYAIADVTYLRDVYEQLRRDLLERSREDWVRSDMDQLVDPETHIINPEEVWQRVKIRSDKPKTLAVLRALAAWREREAMDRDLPRTFILRDEVLSELARQAPRSEKDLGNIRGLPEKFRGGKHAALLLERIKDAQETPKSSWPRRPDRDILPQDLVPALEMLKMLLRIQAADHGLVPRLIAAQEDLEALLLGTEGAAKLRKGWRYEIFGGPAEDLLAGKISLGLKDKKIAVLPLTSI